MLFEGKVTSIFDDLDVGIAQIMRTDIQERDGSFLLEIELPGYARENIEADLADGKLTIIANKPESIEKEETKINYIHRERIIGGCKRTFFVGNDIKQEDIKASFNDGILSVIIVSTKNAVEEKHRKLIPIN